MARKLHLHSSIQLTNTSNSRKNKLSIWRTRSILYSGSFLQQLNSWQHWLEWLRVCSMLLVDLRYCARVPALPIHCTIMFPCQRMHGGRSREFNVLTCCQTVHLLQRRIGCRGRGAAQSCACMTYTSQFEYEYESSFVLLSYFRMNIQNFVRSFHP